MFWPDDVFYILIEKGFLAKQIDICVVCVVYCYSYRILPKAVSRLAEMMAI